MFRYAPAADTHEMFYQGDVVGGFTIQADGALLLFMAKGAIKLWRDGHMTTIVEEIPEERESRFNDVIADPVGRVFCGTMASGDSPGNLYRLDTDGTLTKVLEGIGCSNGMGFTLDRKGMYYTDSMAFEIYLFDYDQATGALSNRRVFVQSASSDGYPDGMTVDAEGCVWSARWDGHCLVRFSPEGQEMSRVLFPVPKVSSLIFGGPDYTDIYVTTAGGDKKETDGALAGSLFHLNLGIRGLPEFYSRVGL
jgi:D-xylonolactonase